MSSLSRKILRKVAKRNGLHPSFFSSSAQHKMKRQQEKEAKAIEALNIIIDQAKESAESDSEREDG